MTKKNGLKKALIMAIISVFVCLSMFVGTTFAWFTDSVTSNGNIIKAGRLDVAMYWAEGNENPEKITWKNVSEGAIFNYDKWEPGYVEAKYIKVVNEGSLAFKWVLRIVPNGEVEEIADVIDVYFVEGVEQLSRDDLANTVPVCTLRELINDADGVAHGSLLPAGETETTNNYERVGEVLGTIAFKMREEAGNEYQDKKIGTDFAVRLLAIQYTYENDQFGSDYDEGLEPEATYVFGAQNLKDAMTIKDSYIKLNSDIVVDSTTSLQWGSYMFVANGREVTIDLNGHDITVEEDALLKTNAVFTTANGGTLNIVGEGSVVVKNGKSGIFHAMNANDQINIYSGTYVSNCNNGSDSLAIMYTNSGNIDVYGGQFYSLDGVEVANAEDKQGNRLCIMYHEGAILNTQIYQRGDSARIKLAEGCYLKSIQIDGKECWQVAKAKEDETIIKAFADMVDVCKTGGTMILAGDLTYSAENTEMMINGSVFLVNGKSVVVDLNGHDIVIEDDATQVTGALFFVGNPGGHIDIVGEGSITIKNGLAPIVWVLQSGTANIWGGTYESNSVSNEAMIYSQGNGGVINVYGGTYKYDLDRHLNGGFNVSDQAGNALRIIIHENVLLSRPEYSQHLQGTTNGEEKRIQLAEGCTIEEVLIGDETWYQVVKK